MKVILLADVKKVGRKGEVVEVSSGYASNFLIPRKLAVIANEANHAKLEKSNAEEEARQKVLKEQAEADAAKLASVSVEFKAKVGSDGRMFGSISPKQIEEETFKQHGIKIDKRKFIDKYPANALGYTKLKIELYKGSQGEVIGTVSVHISEDK